MKAVAVYAILGVFTLLTLCDEVFGNEIVKSRSPRGLRSSFQVAEGWLTDAYEDLSNEVKEFEHKLVEMGKKLLEEIKDIIRCEQDVINDVISYVEGLVQDGTQCLNAYLPIWNWLKEMKKTGKELMGIMERVLDGIPACAEHVTPGQRIYDRATEALKCMTDTLSREAEYLPQLWEDTNKLYEEAESLIRPDISRGHQCVNGVVRQFLTTMKDSAARSYQCIKEFSLPNLP